MTFLREESISRNLRWLLSTGWTGGPGGGPGGVALEPPLLEDRAPWLPVVEARWFALPCPSAALMSRTDLTAEPMPSNEDDVELRAAAYIEGDPYDVLNLEGPPVLWALGVWSGAGDGAPPVPPPRPRLGGMVVVE